MKRHLRALRAVAFVTYKEWAAYRSHSLVSLFVGPVFFLSQVFIWRALYTGHELLGGMTLDQMLTYFAMVTLVGYLTMDFADWNLQMLIRTGKFTTFMLRPMHHRFFALSQKLGHRLLGFLYEFIPVFLIMWLLLGIKLSVAYPLWAILSIALGFLMTFYINYCIGIAGFWLTRTAGARAIFQLVSRVFSGVFLPLSFFPHVLQGVLLFLPFQFTVYLPISVCIGTYSLGGVTLPIPAAVGMQAAAVLVMILLSELLYRRGIRHFSGVGV